MKNYIEHYKIDAQNFDYFEHDLHLQAEHFRRYQQIFHLTQPQKNDLILEIGSGGGPALQFFDSKEWTYIPFDLSINNISQILSKSIHCQNGIFGDAFKLPFQDNSIDVIILSEVLEHLPFPDLALSEISRILKRNSGRVLISVPWRENIQHHLCIHCNQLTPSHAHLHSYSEESLSQSLLQNHLSPQIIDFCLNKILHRLFGPLLSKLPYKAWRILEYLFNRVAMKPASLMILARTI